MSICSWKTQPYNNIVSLLFNNPNRIIRYQVRDADGKWVNRADQPAPVVRLYEQEAPPERTCLETIQFVHHALIPPGGRHVHELHIHPDAEEIVVVTRGRGLAIVDGVETPVAQEDVIYIPSGAEHEIRNTGDDVLGVLFVNVPTGPALERLAEAQRA